jgi:hypothetical protein
MPRVFSSFISFVGGRLAQPLEKGGELKVETDCDIP